MTLTLGEQNDLTSRTAADTPIALVPAGEIADRVLPALTAAMTLLDRHDQAEADFFRGTVLVAIEAALRAGPAPPWRR